MSIKKLPAPVFSFFCGFIPRYVSNGIISAVYTFMGELQRVWSAPGRIIKQQMAHRAGQPDTSSENTEISNRTENEIAFSAHLPEIKKKHGYIEDQHRYTDMTYGKGCMQASGCGIFAVYNALAFLLRNDGQHQSSSISFDAENSQNELTHPHCAPQPVSIRPDLPGLIRDFEANGMVLNGIGGTAPRAIQKYLAQNGIPNRFTCRADEFPVLAAASRCIILTIFNDRNDIRRQMHTICVTREANGYVAHNVTGNGTIVGPSDSFLELMEVINEGKSRVFFMVGIQ